MTINHKHKFIFIHVTKTGGSTVKRLFSSLNTNDIENIEPIDDVLSTYDFKGRQKRVNGFSHTVGHMPISFIKMHYNEEFNDYFKFGFVRNPYKRAVSSFLYRWRKFIKDKTSEEVATLFESSFLQYLPSIVNRNPWFAPQHAFLCDLDDNIIVDYIGRTENLNDHIKIIFDKINVPLPDNIEIAPRNVSPKYNVDYNLLLTDKNKEIIYNVYKKDFEIFNFER